MRAKHANQIRKGIKLARARACFMHGKPKWSTLTLKAYIRETEAMQERSRKEFDAQMRELEAVQIEILKAKRDRLQTTLKFQRIIMANFGGGH